MKDPTTGACPPVPPPSVAGGRSSGGLVGRRVTALIGQAVSLLRLAGSQCCVGRTQAAWARTRDRDESAAARPG
ncbi:MAG TPA: hypothetical protein VN840_07920 [Streptosporangiaceae bacterium]|nr:hypothetical protein [Streptosporangiaceae bacterium]